MGRIEDYAIIGDLETAALVGRDGSIDWLCLPHFNSPACFAALLGSPAHGRWLVAPLAQPVRTARRYRGSSLILETDFVTESGTVRLVDFMPPRVAAPDLVRVVEGLRGEVTMRMELIIRFDYGSIVPWVRNLGGALHAAAGPDAISFWSPVPTRGAGLTTTAEFTVREGERVPFALAWHPSHTDPPEPPAALAAVSVTEAYWQKWCTRFSYVGPWREAVLRSAITLKALTFAPTGGIVAAATTSLPEKIGGVRNWDYRHCWLRDATFTLFALMSCGFREEAAAWRRWLLRAVAGEPSKLQIMYGPSGERRLPEMELEWLPGYEGSAPVRIGNAATTQLQLDVYGEVMDALHVARHQGLAADEDAWALQVAILRSLESLWLEPDEGIWEVRGPRRHFTHSKVMAWAAFDRGIKAIERFGLTGPVDDWRAARERLHREVCVRGFSASKQAFIQFYGSEELDASLLMVPLVGFLPADDPRVLGTVAAVERELTVDGLVYRYRTSHDGHVDGLPAGEGVFLACTFWLADNYVLQGRVPEATRLFDRLLSLANDVGLLAEQYDPVGSRLMGNFPQALSHVSLINTAQNLTRAHGPAAERREM